MSNNLQPNRRAQWILFCASAVPIVVGMFDVLAVKGPGDQKMSAGMGLAFGFIPLSFLFAVILAIMTCARWRGATNADRLRGLLPLSFPVVAVLAVSFS